MTDEALTEYDSIFCANTGCVLHVRPGNLNVRGSGNWAQFEDGTVIGRRRVESTVRSMRDTRGGDTRDTVDRLRRLICKVFA